MKDTGAIVWSTHLGTGDPEHPPGFSRISVFAPDHADERALEREKALRHNGIDIGVGETNIHKERLAWVRSAIIDYTCRLRISSSTGNRYCRNWAGFSLAVRSVSAAVQEKSYSPVRR